MSEFDSELYFRVAFFAFLIPLGSADCVDLDLGMESGAIPDNKIAATSELSAAKNGRLNYTSGSSWCARPSDTNPYLHIDLQALYIICAVSTQGNFQADYWVKNYTLQFSNDGTTWMVYREGGQIKTFQGNSDTASEVKHVLYESVEAHHLQILPSAYHGAVCMRVEVFGVKRKPVNFALGKATFQSSTFNNTKRGLSGVSEKAVDGNSDTDFRNGSCAHTWSSNPSWWRVDLGSDKVPVSDIFIVNRFSTVVMARSKNYKITLGNNQAVVNNRQCKGLYSFVNFKASAVCFTNPLITGRYVGISTVREQFLQLCEVEIYLRDNLAFGKQTDQSSVSFGGVSSRAVDGISTTDYYANSCTHTGKELNPWWRVDLGQVEPVSEIYLVNQENQWFYRQSNFEIRVGTVFNNGGITNPRCGDKSYSLPRGKGVSFFCHPVLFGRYVIIRSLRIDLENFTLCEVEVYSERRACQMQAIGVASTDTLPDATFSASTESTNFEAFRGRLNALRGWSPSSNDRPYDHLQIDLQYEFLICAVATQGRSTSDDWTTKYKLQLSLDGSTFVTYKENNVDKTFSGNSGRHDIVKHNLRDVRARFIRFQPVKFVRNKALRVEVYGVLISRVPSQAPSELTLSATSSTSITASWQLPPTYSRHGIIAGFKLSYKKKGFIGSIHVETNNGGTTFSGVINGLDKYTEYEFQVLAFTSHGDGPESSVVVERTMEDVPSQPPSGLTVAASSFTSVLAFWRLPPEDSRNGIITGYKLFYRETGGDRSPTVQILIQNAAIRSRYITGLQADTEYDFQVLAFTSVGDGPKSSVKVVRTAVDAVEVGKREGSKSVSIVQIAVPVVLVIVLVPLLLVAILLYRRRRRAENSGQEIDSNEVRVPLDEFRMDSVESGGITTDLVYQNVSEIPSDGNEFGKTSLPEEKESVYSEADDGKPKPIPVAEFAEYFKNKSANGSIVLEDEFEKLPSIFPFSWDVGKNNKVKNRFGNITTYDRSRVVLEKIEGDPKSDYINASYIPTVDEESMNYIATQGPTSTTISDFWRMIWQKSCSVIVMLTNLVELGKNKCDQYWPDSTTTFGSITVTLLRTQSFADYCIRTLKLVKGKKTREVYQYHFTSWPDRGVPHHSTALLAFRWKVHVQNQATGGPLVVHCSAGVGRTGTYIAIDAMLEGAKKKNTVFIQNYVQVMRKHRPYMVQNDTQYVFIHQAVMEALTCGTTEVTSQNLRIRMNKLARVMSDAKQTGYAEEFKHLERLDDCQSSGEEFVDAFKPSNLNKNRFSNIVPMDTARVMLRSSEPDKDYINASFVDDYSRRKAYILTQAPLNDTVNDFWRMISQYDIGTVVMLNSLKEEKESYPQYWPSEGSAKYGDITLQLLSKKNSKNITTRKFSVINVMPPKKTSTVQHIQYTGWPNGDSNPDPQEILDLLTVIEQSQQQSGDSVIVFQCSDGVGRSGCVATIMSVIERVKIEQTVDVFQTIKLIRAKRPGAVNTLDLYSFCYKTILAYLDSFKCYSNFEDC